MSTTPIDLLTPFEVAELLSVSPKTVYRWINTGELPAVRLGPQIIRVARQDLEAFIGTPSRHA